MSSPRHALSWILAAAAVLACTHLASAQIAGVRSTLQSVPVRVHAQPATVFGEVHRTLSARLSPAEPFSLQPSGRQLPALMLAPKAVFDRLKAAALRNSLAPRDPFVRSSIDATLGASSTVTPTPILRFAGLGDLDTLEPPDMALAVSPSFVVQGVNAHFAVYNRSGAIQAGWPKSFASFFHVPSPGSCNPVPFMSDPRAFFIMPDQRFVLAAVQVDGPVIGTTCAPLSKYWVAVSQTNNPNGGWNVYNFDMRLGTANVADFTQIGFDANGIYLSGNMFTDSLTPLFQYAEILGVPKAKMEAGQPVVAHGFSKLMAGGFLVDTVHPVESLTQPPLVSTPQPVEYFIDSNNINVCAALCSGVTVWAFANVLGTPSLTAVNVATTGYALPPPADQSNLLSINTGDQRISATPVYQGGLISFGLNTAIFNGAVAVTGIFWGQVAPHLTGTAITSASLTQSGYLSFTFDRSAYYPALIPDSRGDLFMAFGSSAFNMNASGFYVARKVTDPPGTFGPAVQLFGGRTFYSFGRWGDYSAAAIDGNATSSDAWFGVEYAGPLTDWNTEIGATRFP